MEPQMIDLVVPLFFLSGLILIARFKKQLSGEDKGGYRYISAGLLILTLVALSRVYSKIGVFNTVPFVSEPLFYDLVFWIGIITGLTFLISGISNWLPLSQTYGKYNRMQIRRFDLIKRVVQLVGVERRLAVILSKALQYMVEHYGFLKGAAYLYSQKQKTLVYLSCSGSVRLTEADIKGILFDEGYEKKLLEKGSSCDGRIVRDVPKTIPRPNLALPLVVNGKLSALFLLWHDERVVCNDEDRVNLKIATDIIARKVEHDKLQVAEAFRRQLEDRLQNLAEAIDHKRPIKENVSKIAKWFTEMTPADLISLTIIYDEKNIQRFSIGEDGALLAEKGVDVHSHNRLLEHIFESGEPLVVKDTRQKTTMPVDKMILNSAMRSLAAFPLDYARTTVGAVVVASKQADRFGGREIESIKGAIPLLCNLVAQEIYRCDLSVGERRISLLNGFLADCGRTANLQKLFEQAAGHLSKELKTSVVRISTCDYDGAFLKSRALSLLRPIEGITPADGHMILSLMPYHTLARDTGRLMMVNQQHTDKKITEAEAKQMASSDLKSALLIPVKVDEQVLAIISLAEMRRWGRYRYTQADILFASSIATALSLAIQMILRRQTKASLKPAKDRFSAVRLHDPEVKSRIKSSLSGILGSVEMIKSHQPVSDTSLDRYLSIIDRSAQRINEYFGEEVFQ